jgi:uncharacterized protein
MELAKELFEVPYKGRTFLYAPLSESVLEVSQGLIFFLNQIKQGKDPRTINPDLTDKLLRARILTKKQDEKIVSKSCSGSELYLPTSVTLLPTYDCNLRCKYCYARAGEEVGKVMDKEVAKSSLDFIIENAIQLKKRQIHLGFHGGGEPLYPANRQLLDYAVNYLKEKAKSSNLKYSISAVSNGLWGENTFKWAIENLNNVNISLDGPKDIQNSQRPIDEEGKIGSYDIVINTIKMLEATKTKDGKKFPYGIRATITDASVGRMEEIIGFFHSVSSNKSFHLEPLFECGRCAKSNAKSPKPEDFLENFLKAERKAKELGIEIYYSGGSLEKIGQTFCGACGSNFFVTPNGYVTSCLEACRENDAVSNVFYIGKFNAQTKQFEFDNDRINTLKGRRVEKISFCEYCFGKYNCSGDCPAKVFEQTGDIMDPSNNWRCIINLGLLTERMAQAIDRSKDGIGKLEQKSDKKLC